MDEGERRGQEKEWKGWADERSSDASDGRCHNRFTPVFHLAESNWRLSPAVIGPCFRPQQNDPAGPARLFAKAINRRPRAPLIVRLNPTSLGIWCEWNITSEFCFEKKKLDGKACEPFQSPFKASQF